MTLHLVSGDRLDAGAAERDALAAVHNWLAWCERLDVAVEDRPAVELQVHRAGRIAAACLDRIPAGALLLVA
jgi:hypothetical protein